jgi:hypothetical protein
MNLVEPSPLNPGDDLDGLLRAFFRGQMPHPWPSPRMARLHGTRSERPPSSGRGRNRSRWALAASVALLLLGSLFLSGRIAPSSKPGEEIEGPTIGSHDIPKRMEKEHKIKEHENKNKTGLEADDGDQLQESDELDMR